MSNKKFLVQYTGTGQGLSRSVIELPVDEKLEGRALDTKIRALAEMKIKKSNRRDRGTIRIVSVKPYNDSAEDIMTDKIKAIAEKYNIGDADFSKAAIENLKDLVAKARKAVKAGKSGDRNAVTRLMNDLVMARSAARSEYDALAKEAFNLTGELDNLVSTFKKGK